MLTSFNDCLHAKKVNHQLIPSTDIDDQRILQSDWRGTTGQTQPKMVVFYLLKIISQLIPSIDIDCQRILQSDWLRAI